MLPKNDSSQPDTVTQLQRHFGGPSDAAFGSAVFFESGQAAVRLEEEALGKYQYFCGKTWKAFGEENWLSNWKLLYSRMPQQNEGIVSELRALQPLETKSAAMMLLDDPEAATLLQSAFDVIETTALHIYSLGDGSAMSGLLIAAQRLEGRVFLTFLLD